MKEFISDRRPLGAWVPLLCDISYFGGLHVIECLLTGLEMEGSSKIFQFLLYVFVWMRTDSTHLANDCGEFSLQSY